MLCVSIPSCDNDDDGLSKETIVGTWKMTDVEVNGTWYDVSSGFYGSIFGASISFYSNGTYYGKGALGNGWGTWKKSGKTITTYVDGEVYIVYKVSSCTETKMTGSLKQGSTSMNFKASKQ